MCSFISHWLSCTSVFLPGRFLVSRAFPRYTHPSGGFHNVVHRDPIHSGGLQGPRPDPTLLEPLRHRLEFSGHASESAHRLFRIPLRWHCQVRALVADVDPRRVRMYYLQTDIVGLDLPRQLTALFSTHALPLAGRATRSCLCLLRLSFPGGFMLCCPCFLRSRLGPVGENYTISPAGSSRGPFSRTTPPPSSQSPSTGATLIFGQ